MFDTSTTNGLDICCDAIWPFGNNYLDFHSKIDNQSYVINYLAFPTEETSVPMYSVSNPDTGLFTVGINNYYGNSNTFGFFKDNTTGEFHTSPYQTTGPVSGQRFTFYTTVPIEIETINSCDFNGGQVVIHNPNTIESAYIYKNGELFLTTNDTIISGLESANYEYVWQHPVGQEQVINFSISNTPVDVTFQIPNTVVSIYDAFIIPELTIQSYSQIIWDFGDGTLLYDDVNPVHQYLEAGVYTMVVTVISNNGCVKIFTQEITVFKTSGFEPILKRDKKYLYTYGIDGKLLKKY
jgi:PKD repeat protein